MADQTGARLALFGPFVQEYRIVPGLTVCTTLPACLKICVTRGAILCELNRWACSLLCTGNKKRYTRSENCECQGDDESLES
jgi:hypothetical protein